MPQWIPPMKATMGQLSSEAGWAAELKWDGLRTQVLTDGKTTIIRSSTGRDITSQFPELDRFGAELGVPAVFDGELVVFEGDRPSFQRVLGRLNTGRPTQQSVGASPATYVIFDLLMLDGNTLIDLPYRTRRQVLEDLMVDGPAWRVPPSAPDGAEALYRLAGQRDLEGIVMKRLDSLYRPGSRSSDWRKVKIRLGQEFVIGGWLAGQGSLENEIGSLVLGVWDGPELTMAGLAGSGLTDGVRADLKRRLRPRSSSPFAQASTAGLDRVPQWVEPELVVQVEFADWPADGMLRHPTFVGLRDDKDPGDVVREIRPPGRGPTPSGRQPSDG